MEAEVKEQTENQQAIIAALAEIAECNGGILQVDAVIDAARPLKSPLHGQFEWDDGEAAHHYRQWQARQLIRVTVKYLPAAGDSVRVFVSLTTDRYEDGGGYRRLVSVMSDKDMREQLLSDAHDDMTRFKQKYRHLSELAEVIEAMTAAQRKKLAA